MKKGDIYKTNGYGDVEVILVKNSRSVVVKFIDTGTVITNISGNIRKGAIKDPMRPSVYGVGYIGVGQCKKFSSFGKKSSARIFWENMMKRCYSDLYQLNQPTYIGCSVDEEWHNFQNFAKWFEDNFNYESGDQNLDKDLLIYENKVYSKSTCIFVPKWLNSFLLDRGRSRGEYPIGVSIHKKSGLFMAYCNANGKKIHLGYHSTPERAHDAWLKFKLNLALERKEDMDMIDERIYPNVIRIIKDTK